MYFILKQVSNWHFVVDVNLSLIYFFSLFSFEGGNLMLSDSLCFRHLRMDMLSLILSLANVGGYAEVLVLDMLGGLLTASVAERLGGNVVSLICHSCISSMELFIFTLSFVLF